MRSEGLADEARSVYASGTGFIYDHVSRDKVVPIKRDADTWINIKVNTKRKSMEAIPLLLVEPYAGGRGIQRSTASPT